MQMNSMNNFLVFACKEILNNLGLIAVVECIRPKVVPKAWDLLLQLNMFCGKPYPGEGDQHLRSCKRCF